MAVISDGTHKTPNYTSSGVPFLSVQNISSGRLDMGKSKYIAKEEHKKLCERIAPQKGDILLCRIGTLGKAIKVYWDFEFSIFVSLGVLRPILSEIADYIVSYINSPIGFRWIQSVKVGGGTHTYKINLNDIPQMLICIPPLEEQYWISNELNLLNDKVIHYGRLQERLDELSGSLNAALKKSILQEAIQGKLTSQDPTDEPASVLLDRIRVEKEKLLKVGKIKKKDIVDSVIYKGEDNKYYEKVGDKVLDISDDIPFELPESWQWVRLANITNLYTGNSISETEKRSRYTNVKGKEYIGTKDVGFDHQINYANGVAIPERYLPDFRIAPSDSVLMCIEGGSAGRKIAILKKDVCFGNKLCCFAPYAKIANYIYYYLQSPTFFEVFQRNKTGIIGGVSVNTLKELIVALPPLDEQVRIVEKIQSLKL